MISLPHDAQAAAQAAGDQAEFRAGGTDFQERVELGLTAPHVVDLCRLQELRGVKELEGGGLLLGARLTLSELVDEPRLQAGYPALVAAAEALATPQIRNLATLGGSLLQRSRCWYYRSAHFRCLKSGGVSCLARAGDHQFHACFDLGPCVAPHPSTVGMALLLYDAKIQVQGDEERSLEQLFGDGTDGKRDHQLAPGALLMGVRLPGPTAGEGGGYFRAIGRAYAEWPLVEAGARLVIESGRIALVRLAMGGVAPIPLPLPQVEALLLGKEPSEELFLQAAERAKQGAQPLPGTAYKLQLLAGTVAKALSLAWQAGGQR